MSLDMEEEKQDMTVMKEEDVTMATLDDAQDEGNKILELVSQEEETFPVKKRVAIQSKLIKTMSDGDKEQTIIPLPQVNSTVLKKIIQYMEHHVDNPAREIEKPLKSANMSEVVSGWDADFVDVPNAQIFELTTAANYLDLTPLLELTCSKVASKIKGKTPEEIRQEFGIVNDFT